MRHFIFERYFFGVSGIAKIMFGNKIDFSIRINFTAKIISVYRYSIPFGFVLPFVGNRADFGVKFVGVFNRSSTVMLFIKRIGD